VFSACGGGGSGATTPAVSASGSSGDASTAGALLDGSTSGGDSAAPMSDATLASDGPTGMVSGTAGSCANPTVTIDFDPMYSAFIPGSTAHVFAIPAVTDDGNQASWALSDPTQANLVGGNFNGLPGVLITVMGVGAGSDGGEGAYGTITVYATEADGTCGSAVLTITAASENDWMIGEARYNDGVGLTLTGPGGGGPGMRPDGGEDGGPGGGGAAGDDGGPGGGPGDGGPGMRPDGGGAGFRTSDGGSFYERDGGTACNNCHGPTAMSGPYKDVSHTPEQTGGFSDTDLIGIITEGIIPDGGYFDPAVINPACDGSADCTAAAFQTWHSFHRWADITSDEYAGIVTYLRSLTPVAQNGSPGANFGRGGGGGRRDGGPPGMMRMGGGDAGAPADAGSE
jgi:hypothetical protein